MNPYGGSTGTVVHPVSPVESEAFVSSQFRDHHGFQMCERAILDLDFRLSRAVDDLAQNYPSLRHRRSRCSRLSKWARLYTRSSRVEQQRGARRRNRGDGGADVFLGEEDENRRRGGFLMLLPPSPYQRRAAPVRTRPGRPITDPRQPIRCLGAPPAPAALGTKRRLLRTPRARRRRAVPGFLPGPGYPVAGSPPLYLGDRCRRDPLPRSPLHSVSTAEPCGPPAALDVRQRLAPASRG